MLQTFNIEKVLVDCLLKITKITDEIYIEQGFETDSQGPYPTNLTREEFLAAAMLNPALSHADTVVIRDPDNQLQAIQYANFFKSQFSNIIHLLNNAADHTNDKPFQDYLKAAAICYQDPSRGNCQMMTRKWLDARESPLQLVMVWDETYSDTFLGVKGSMDSALFLADETLSDIVQKPVDSWSSFEKTFHFPGNSHNFSGFYTRVYETLSLGGALHGMQLRAWNLPDDLEIRKTMGSHQMILRENTLNTLDNDLIPMIQRLFNLKQPEISHEDFLDGLLWTLTAHELGHNLACYREQKTLLELNDAFEELKANIFPLIWVLDQHSKSNLSSHQAEAAIAVYLSLNLMDCILAKTIPGRRSYAKAAWIQMNRLNEMDAIAINNDRISINLSQMESANRKLLDEILLIMSRGNYSEGNNYINTNANPMNISLLYPSHK